MTQTPVLIYLAGVPWDAVEGTDHRLVQHLDREMTTVWVDPPTSMLNEGRPNAEAQPQEGLSRVRPGLWRLHTVTIPGLTRTGTRSVVRWQIAHAVRQLPAAFPGREFVLFASRPDVDLRNMPGALRVLHVTDDFVAGADLMGLGVRSTRRNLDRALAHADVVLAVTPVLAERLRRPGLVVGVLPNGCEPSVLVEEPGSLPPGVTLTHPIAGVVGQLNDRLDINLLEDVADADVSLMLIGPRCERRPETRRSLDRLIRRPNVQWVGRKPYDELPAYLGALHVGLTPYVDSDFNRASDPLKTLEYLAAGRPVVTTDLPAARRLSTEVVDIAPTREDFVAAVVRRVSGPLRPHTRDLCRAEAGKHSWQVRAAQLVELFGRAPVWPHDEVADGLGARDKSAAAANRLGQDPSRSCLPRPETLQENS